MSRSTQKLKNNFKNKEYAHAYVREFLNTQIATQIRMLREERELSQKELASIADMRQSRISVLEDVYNNMWSISTLQRLAEAFDVTLNVTFDTFSNRIRDMQNLSRELLEKEPREKDLYAQQEAKTKNEVSSNNIIQFPTNGINLQNEDEVQFNIDNMEEIRGQFNG